MVLGSGVVGGAEDTALLAASNDKNMNSTSKKTETGGQVRRRLAVSLFLHITGAAIVTQIYPKVTCVLTFVPIFGQSWGGEGKVLAARLSTVEKISR